jgi:hypothetical protein
MVRQLYTIREFYTNGDGYPEDLDAFPGEVWVSKSDAQKLCDDHNQKLAARIEEARKRSHEQRTQTRKEHDALVAAGLRERMLLNPIEPYEPLSDYSKCEGYWFTDEITTIHYPTEEQDV